MDYANQTDLLWECTSIYYHHINIRRKSVIVHHLAHAEEIPVFCQVHHLLKIGEQWIIIAEMLHTVSFNEKLWAYEVEFAGTLVKIDVEHCFNIFPHCLNIYVIEQEHYINILTRLTKQ